MPWLSWSEVHGAATHMPVAFLLAAPVFDLAALRCRKPELNIVSFWMLIGAVVTAVPSLLTGWITYLQTFAPNPPAPFQNHWIAAVIASVIAVGLAVWRVRARDVLTAKARTATMLISLLAAGAVSYTGYLGGKMVFGDSVAVTPGLSAAPNVSAGPTPAAALPPIDTALVAKGEKIYLAENCKMCHKMGSNGRTSAPDLTYTGARHPEVRWHVDHLKAPDKVVLGSTMPAYNDFPPDKLQALAAYLASRR